MSCVLIPSSFKTVLLYFPSLERQCNVLEVNIFTYKTTTSYIDEVLKLRLLKNEKKKLSNFEIAILLVFFPPVLLNFILTSLKLEFAPQLLFLSISENEQKYCLPFMKFFVIPWNFYAAYIIGGPGVWLYKSIWFNISDKPGCGARVYYPRKLLLHKSYSWTLVYIPPISSFPVLQCENVSFLLLSFSISLCFINFVLLKLLDLVTSIYKVGLK